MGIPVYRGIPTYKGIPIYTRVILIYGGTSIYKGIRVQGYPHIFTYVGVCLYGGIRIYKGISIYIYINKVFASMCMSIIRPSVPSALGGTAGGGCPRMRGAPKDARKAEGQLPQRWVTVAATPEEI